MDLNAVVVKTRKGQDEIETRAHKLPGRLRAVLIMVDGERTGAELLDQAGELADQLMKQIDDLIKLGFLEQMSGQMAVVQMQPPVELSAPVTRPEIPAPSTPSQIKGSASTWTAVPLDVLKSRLGKMLNDSLGMRAMFMTAQLNAVTSHGGLESVIDDMAKSLATTMGADAARKWRMDARSALGLPA